MLGKRKAAPQVWRYAAAAICESVPIAMMLPLIALYMNDSGTSPIAIGFYGALPFILTLINLPLVPRVLAAVGFARMFRTGLALSTAGLVLSALTRDYVLLCIGASLVGIGAAYRWSATEALIAWTTPTARLGRVTGLYQSFVAAAAAVGPFLVPVFSLRLETAAGLAIGLTLFAWLPIISLSPKTGPELAAPEALSGSIRWWVFVPLATLGFIGGVFEAGLNALGPIQATRLGVLPSSSAVTLTGVIALASLATQYPIGRLADRFGGAALFRALSVTLLLSLVAVPLSKSFLAGIWFAAIAWGGAGGSLYTLSIIEVGIAYRNVPQAVSAIIGAYTIGGATGPVIGGVGLEISTEWGLAMVLGTLILAAWPLAFRAPRDVR